MNNLRWGHCPCGVAIARERAFCPRCEEKSLALLAAIVQQAQRDERARERRFRIALLLRLLALCWFATVALPTWDHGTESSALAAASVGLLVLVLATLISPRRRRKP
jgi:hypothetical protein